MQFIDTHIHLQDYKQNCATDILSAMSDCGCKKLINVSAVEADWGKIKTLAEKYPERIVPAYGLHPWYIEAQKENWQTRLEMLLRQNPQALVGECGLDKLKAPEKAVQVAAFIEQANLAKQYHRPLIVHMVKSFGWLEEIWSSLPQKFVLHSFNGEKEQAGQVVKRGGYISFSASIMKNKNAAEIIRALPEDKILVETDGPYQALEKHQESDISFLPRLINFLAEQKQEKAENLAAKIYQNSLEFIKTW